MLAAAAATTATATATTAAAIAVVFLMLMFTASATIIVPIVFMHRWLIQSTQIGEIGVGCVGILRETLMTPLKLFLVG